MVDIDARSVVMYHFACHQPEMAFILSLLACRSDRKEDGTAQRPSKALCYTGVEEAVGQLRSLLAEHRPVGLVGFRSVSLRSSDRAWCRRMRCLWISSSHMSSQGATAAALLLASLQRDVAAKGGAEAEAPGESNLAPDDKVWWTFC
jgi:hypothetical protein